MSQKRPQGNSAISVLHRAKLRAIALGFGVSLLLFVLLISQWFQSTMGNNGHLHDLANKHHQIQLLSQMVHASQDQTQGLMRLLQQNQNIEWRGHIENLNATVENYKNWRHQLMPALPDDEKSLLRALDELSDQNILTQRQIIKLLEQKQTEKAKRKLLEDFLPLQNRLTHELMHMLGSYSYSSSSQLIKTSKLNLVNYWLVVLLGFCVFILGVFAIVLSRKVGSTESDMAEQSKRASALFEVTTLSTKYSDEQIHEILKTGCHLLNMDIAKVSKIDTEHHSITFINTYANVDYDVKPGFELPLDKSFSSVTYSEDKITSSPNIRESIYKNYHYYEMSYCQSYIGTPIYINNKRYGTVDFSSLEVHEKFSPKDFELMQLIANWISIALERKIAEQLSLEKELAMLTNFTNSAFISHLANDFRTPLHSIIGYVEMIADELVASNNNIHNEDVQRILSSCKQLSSMVDEILDFTRGRASDPELRVQHFSIPTLIDELSKAVRPIMDMNTNKLLLRSNEMLGLMKSDQARVREILYAMIVMVCTERHHETIEFLVERLDQGESTWIEFSVRAIAAQHEQDNSQLEPVLLQVMPVNRDLIRNLCASLGGKFHVDVSNSYTLSARLPSHIDTLEPIPGTSMAINL